MSDEPKFVAKVIRNLPVKNDSGKGQLDEFIHSEKVFSKIKDVAPTIPTIDISVSTTVFKRNIQKVMDEEPLTNHFFLFSSRRRSEKIKLERERVNDLLSIIDRAIETNRNIIRYNVDVFITQQTLERLALEHVVNLEKYARSVLREEELLARLHIDNLDKVDDDADERKEKIRAIKIANDKVTAEINHMQATTRITNAQADILDRIKTELNLSNITSSQAFVLVKALDPKASADTDFAVREAMMNAEIDRMKAETAKAHEQAEQEKTNTEHKKWKNERERNRPKE